MSYKFSKEELEKLLIDYNKIAFEHFNLKIPDQAYIWDETLRDGEQSPTVYLTINEKIHLTKLMDEIGVNLIAVGFPAVSKSEKNIVKSLVRENSSSNFQKNIKTKSRTTTRNDKICYSLRNG